MSKRKLLELTLAEISRLEKNLHRTQQAVDWYKDKLEEMKAVNLTLSAANAQTKTPIVNHDWSEYSTEPEKLIAELKLTVVSLEGDSARNAEWNRKRQLIINELKR